MLGEIYPAFLATFGIGQHPRNAGAMLTAAGEYVFVHGSLSVGVRSKQVSETCWIGLRLGRSAQPFRAKPS
jgi:hypothetical protein